jgi:hypothetical protein
MFGKSIEINIQDSEVHGDVVAGNKVVNVHIHEERLTSEAAILAELAQHGLEATGVDELVQKLLKNELFRQKFDAAQNAQQEKQVDEQVAKALTEYERTGPNEQTLLALDEFAKEARKRGQYMTYVKVATLILQFYDRDLANMEKGLRLAEDLVDILRDHPEVKRYVALVRAYQAKHLFFKYTDGVLRLRTALQAHAALPEKLPLAGLVAKQKDILGNRHLADQCMREAIDVSVESGDASLAIAVLFAAESIQEHAYFFERHALRQDAVVQAERVFRLLKLLEELVGKFGDAKEAELVRLSTAHFYLLREEFEQAASLGMATAQALSRLGQSYHASKALDIAVSAQQKVPPVPPPPSLSGEELLRSMSGAQFEETVRDVSTRLLEVSGINLARDKELRDLIESAWKDINPERVMRWCEHLALSSSTSPLGQRIALPTLGMKNVRCAKYGGEIEGADLDGAFSLFKQLYCSSCVGRSPRPNDWKWSPAITMPKKREA